MTSGAPGVLFQFRIRSETIPNIPMSVTPAPFMRSLASAARRSLKVPLASVLAKTSYPASRSEIATNAVQTYIFHALDVP